MPIDFDKLRQKLGQISGKDSGRERYWRPAEGETKEVRIIAFPNNDGQPFAERWFYYNIGNNPGLLAPNQFGKPDPIQELIRQLRTDGAAGNKGAYELAKKLYPKMRCYAIVIVRGEEEKGPRFWTFGKTVYQDLINLMLDPDYGDITDPVEGRDVKVSVSKMPGKTYADTKVTARVKSTPLSGDQALVKKWLSSLPTLDDTLRSYDELKNIVDAWLDGGSDTTPGLADETSKSAEATSVENPTPQKNAKYKSLDEAFADLNEDD